MIDSAYGVIDATCPVNWTAPLAAGMLNCYAAPPALGWYGSTLFRDLVRGGKRPYDATLTNTAFPATSTSGWCRGLNQGFSAVMLDGSDDRIDLGRSFTNASGTVALGVRYFTAPSGNATTACQTDGVFMGLGWQAGSFYVNNFTTASTGSFSTGIDYLLVGTWKSTGIVAYVNGVQTGTGSGDAPTNGGGFAFNLGCFRYSGGTIFFVNARYDFFAAWDRVLSPGQVASLWKQYKTGFPDLLNWVGGIPISIEAGSSSVSVTASDSPSTSDAITRLFAGSRTLSDSPSLTSPITRLLNAFRSTNDTPSTTDAITRSFSGARTLADTLSVTSPITRLFVGARTTTDAPSTADTITRIVSAPRTLTDSPSISDAITRLFVGSRTLTDAPSVSSAVARTLSLPRTTNDSPIVSDAVTRLFVGSRTMTDVPSVSELVSGIKGASISASDAPSTSSTVTRTLGLSRSLADSPSITDAVTRLLVGVRSLTDAPFTSSVVTAAIPTVNVYPIVALTGGIGRTIMVYGTAQRNVVTTANIQRSVELTGDRGANG